MWVKDKRWFSFYLGLVYNLLLIKARAERDLWLSLLRTDVGRIVMSEWRGFGFESDPEMLPAASWEPSR